MRVCMSMHTLNACADMIPSAWHQSDKIYNMDMEDDHIDTVVSHIIELYPISISKMTILLW